MAGICCGGTTVEAGGVVFRAGAVVSLANRIDNGVAPAGSGQEVDSHEPAEASRGVGPAAGPQVHLTKASNAWSPVDSQNIPLGPPHFDPCQLEDPDQLSAIFPGH